ncbi:MAG: hypothetical protein ACRETZ_02015 [Steroidobacteraceae bacterium]
MAERRSLAERSPFDNCPGQPSVPREALEVVSLAQIRFPLDPA